MKSKVQNPAGNESSDFRQMLSGLMEVVQQSQSTIKADLEKAKSEIQSSVKAELSSVRAELAANQARMKAIQESNVQMLDTMKSDL
jgi:ElaB/YqjD/DUF883 family membrane-anchored ribosome-binding protein